MVATKRFYIICDEEVVAGLKTFCLPLQGIMKISLVHKSVYLLETESVYTFIFPSFCPSEFSIEISY